MDAKKPEAEAPGAGKKAAAPVEIENGAEPHPDYPGLTRAQVAEARRKARTSLEAARVKAAMKRAEIEEMDRIEREEGVVAHGVLGEMVTITMDLAPNTAYLAIDGRRFHHRQSYTIPRAVANDLLYAQYKGHEQEAARLGEDKFAFYQQARAPLVKNVGEKVVAVLDGQGVRRAG